MNGETFAAGHYFRAQRQRGDLIVAVVLPAVGQRRGAGQRVQPGAERGGDVRHPLRIHPVRLVNHERGQHAESRIPEYAVVDGKQQIVDRPINAARAEHGLSRRVVLSVTHFMFLSRVLQSTDLAVVASYRLVKDDAGLQLFDLPFAIPGFEMMMLWHERSHRDPAHRWLREQIVLGVNNPDAQGGKM